MIVKERAPSVQCTYSQHVRICILLGGSGNKDKGKCEGGNRLGRERGRGEGEAGFSNGKPIMKRAELVKCKQMMWLLLPPIYPVHSCCSYTLKCVR